MAGHFAVVVLGHFTAFEGEDFAFYAMESEGSTSRCLKCTCGEKPHNVMVKCLTVVRHQATETSPSAMFLQFCGSASLLSPSDYHFPVL